MALFDVTWPDTDMDDSQDLMGHLSVFGGPVKVMPMRLLALWFICEWFRIRYETDDTNTSFRYSHEMTGISGGWSWPEVQFRLSKDGSSIQVGCSMLPSCRDVRSMCSQSCWTQLFPTDSFEREVDTFLNSVIEQSQKVSSRREMNEASVVKFKELEDVFQELVSERGDSLVHSKCRDLAKLGRYYE